ncbi:hypothetical protein GCM10010218_26840 [Streptomyces mashuensis]|uniref:Uncharacterized protein n=1 Tax=Streptomyces mashuensis TaxID=33904 RepID=A0A919B2U7_9ACTN|nr:hypothetical protein [Streptomyces mashuensis]GHF44156.1 hypothetical protein GCM10010218_26840 [Streptomyces mashuensis]
MSNDEGLRLDEFLAYKAELEEKVQQFALGMKQRVAEAEEVVAELIERLPAGEAAPSADGAAKECLPWSLRASAQDWQDLAGWVDWLGRHYAPQLHLRIWPCWPQHGGVVEELAALHSAWRAAAEADADPAGAGSEMAYWHQMWLWPTVERIRQNYMFRECETGHSPDRPGRATDAEALEARIAAAAEERRRRENARYAFFAEVPQGSTPDRPDGLWRNEGDAWEYFSLLDWSWHPAGDLPVPHQTLRPLPTDDALALAADRARWVTYWAHYADALAHHAGQPPTTVCRRRRSPERVYDEAYGPDGAWEPTTAVHDFFDPRPSDPPHLVEIAAAEAERLLHELCGAKGATDL